MAEKKDPQQQGDPGSQGTRNAPSAGQGQAESTRAKENRDREGQYRGTKDRGRRPNRPESRNSDDGH